MASKMKRFVLLFCTILICDCKEDEREPKFFFGPKIQTVVAQRNIPEYVTEFIPSSCVVVEPTLHPCRHVRKLEIYPSVPTRITKTQLPQNQNLETIEPQNWIPSQTGQHIPTPTLLTRPQQVKYTAPYWNWNLFNIFRVQNYTRTATKTEYITTRIQDPNTVVSFYIKGCRPSKLPFNIPECRKPEEVKKDEKSIVVMAPLKFIPNVDTITPTRSENIIKIEEEEDQEEEEEDGKTQTIELQAKPEN